MRLAAQPASAAGPASGLMRHVDPDTGDDSNTGAPGRPWRSLARAAQGPWHAGDSLLLRCGAVFRETLTLGPAQVPEGRLRIGSYGPCTGRNPPEVKGSTLVPAGQWQRDRGAPGQPIWQLPNWSVAVDQLYFNGQPLTRARHPNLQPDGTPGVLLSAAAMNGRSVPLASADRLPAMADLAGATLTARTQPWLYEAIPVAGYDNASGAVQLAQAPKDPIKAGSGVFVEGKRWMLDSAGEWFQERAGGPISVWLPDGATPASGVIEAGTRSTGIAIGGMAGVRIDGVRIEQVSINAVQVLDAPATVINAVQVAFAGRTGVSIDGQSPKSSVTGSTIEGVDSYGIFAIGTGLDISGNVVKDTGLRGRTVGYGAAIWAVGADTVIRKNQIVRAASTGIRFANLQGVRIEDNRVESACQLLTDCGAIYTWNAQTDAALQGASVQRNTVSQVAGNARGAVGGAPAMTAGIYLDDETQKLTVDNNQIDGASFGVFLHNASFNIISRNTLSANRVAAFGAHMTDAASDHLRGNRVLNNVLSVNRPAAAAGTGTPLAQSWTHARNANLFFSGPDANTVSGNQTLTDSGITAGLWRLDSPGTARALRPEDWRAIAPSDKTAPAAAAR